MKVEIQAGAKFDVLTPKEHAQALAERDAAWRGELSRGIKGRRISAWGTPSGGAVTIGEGAGQDPIGPAEGMVWMLKRISVMNYVPATDRLGLFCGDTKGSGVIAPQLDSQYQQLYDEIIRGGQTLVLTGTIASTAKIWMTLSVREAPEYLAWRL